MLGLQFGDVLDRARRGDQAAFAELWRDCNPALVRYLRVVAAGDAEDVGSQAWLELIQSLDRFDGGETDFRKLLFTIGRRRALDTHRRRARRPEHLTDDMSVLEGTAARGADTAALEALSTARTLAMVAEVLPRDQAELVILRVVAGLEPGDIAQMLGRSPGSVRVAIHRALRSLAQHLTERDVTPPH